MIQSSYDAFRRNILSTWPYDVITLKKDALSKRLDQAPVFGEDKDVIYMHSCDLNTQLVSLSLYVIS